MFRLAAPHPFLRGPSSTKAKAASANADSVFLFPVFAYESELSTLRRKTKNAQLALSAFALVVIRLESKNYDNL